MLIKTQVWKQGSAFVFDEDLKIIQQVMKGVKTMKEDTPYLGILPEWFVGNLEKMEVLILNTNPWFSYMNQFENKQFPLLNREKLKCIEQIWKIDPGITRNIWMVGSPSFFFLNPNLLVTGGGRRWYNKLKPVIEEVFYKKYNEKMNNYSDINKVRNVLEWLSTKVACAELYPYHSVSGNWKLINNTLPSTDKMLKTIKRRSKNLKYIIIGRQFSIWDDHVVDYWLNLKAKVWELKSPQNCKIKQENLFINDWVSFPIKKSDYKNFLKILQG